MKITTTTQDGFSLNFADHRGGAVPRQMLAAGPQGTPDNFAWSYSRGNSERYSPRHRHNFDQIRFALKGDMNMGKRKALRQGHVGYFPEGTYYGPQISQEGEEERRAMVVQFTGASGALYLSTDQQRDGQKALLEFGRFEKGVFKRETGEGRKNQDGFEAIWEYHTGRKLEYPRQRYEEPVFIDPDSFAYKPTGARGVSRKLLGVFSERETRIEVWRVEAGATWRAPAGDANRLSFVFEGSGACGGESCPQNTGIWTEPGEALTFRANETAEILHIVMPTWESFVRAQSEATAA